MIFCDNKIYGKVWKVTPSEKYIDLRISTSEKDQEDKRTYSTWFPRAIGHAANSLKNVKEGDNIVITKAKLTNEPYTDKDGNKKSSFRFLVLEAAIQNDTQTAPPAQEKPTAQQQTPPAQAQAEDDPW